VEPVHCTIHRSSLACGRDNSQGSAIPSPTSCRSSKATPIDKGIQSFFTEKAKLRLKLYCGFNRSKRLSLSSLRDSDQLDVITPCRMYEICDFTFHSDGPVPLNSVCVRLAETTLLCLQKTYGKLSSLIFLNPNRQPFLLYVIISTPHF